MDEQTVAELIGQSLTAEKLGRFDEARDLLEKALGRAQGSVLLDTQLRLGRLYVLGGNRFAELAEQLLTQAWRHAETIGTVGQRAAAIHLLALLQRGRGNVDTMQRLLDDSPVKHKTLATSPESGQYYHYRGLLAADCGHYSDAERQFFRANQLYQEIDCETGQAEVFDSLANVLLKRGKTKSALKFCERSLEIKRKLHDRFGEAIALGTMGRIYILRARYADARQAFEADLAIARELNDRRGIGIMLNSLGEVALLQNDWPLALEHYAASLEANNSPIHLAHTQLGLARVGLAAGDLEGAEAAADRLAELLDREHPDAGLVAALIGIRGAILWRRGGHAAGEKLLAQAIDDMHDLNQPLDTIPLLYEMRDLYRARGDMAKAVAVMARAIDLLSECGADRGVNDVEEWLRTVDHPGLTRLALERHFPEHLVEQILKGTLSAPQPKRQPVAILFSDVRGYTTMTEGMPPEEIVELLNEWLSEAARAIRRNGGIIDKFIGDAVMALFGVPESQEDDAARAVQTALDMREALCTLNLRQQALGGKTLQIGIGIDYGEAVVGFIGSHLRQSYTAIGDPVNTASRLEGKTKDFPGCDILISEAVERVQRRFSVAETTFRGAVELKGKEHKVPAYEVGAAVSSPTP